MTSVRIARVLAVDDRRENLVALEAILESVPVEVDTVTSGEEALKRLMAMEYAVILLDAHMPGMDGFETAEHIKQRETTRHIPVIFVTAVDYDTHLAFRSFLVGAVDYIVKPFDPWVLRSKVRVFADLWTMQAELTSRARDTELLRTVIADAAAALEGPDPETDRAAALLRAALHTGEVTERQP